MRCPVIREELHVVIVKTYARSLEEAQNSEELALHLYDLVRKLLFRDRIDQRILRRILFRIQRLPTTKNRVWLPGESILLRSHWVLLVMDVWTRRLVGFDVERGNIEGVSVCRMFNYAIAGQVLPKRVSPDHDPLFRFHRWLANLRALAIEEIKSVPYAPVSHPFIERLIGTVRREYLDHVFFWNAIDLVRKLEEFKDYYNEAA
jgi:hypothetical protein